jgi:predicted permease
MKRQWLRTFRFWRSSPAQDVDTEIRFHFENRISDLMARGLTRDAAATQAEMEFGDRTSFRRELVTIDERMATKRRRTDWFETVLQELRYLIRGLGRSPGFTVTIVVTLGLGLAANTALVSVLDRLLWRPPAGVPSPGDVRRIHNHYVNQRTHAPAIRSVFNYPEMRDLAAAIPEGPGIAGFRNGKLRLGRNSEGREIATEQIIGDYFGVLQLQPASGRFFSRDEARAETFEPVAVISHNLWMSEFGGSAGAIGAPLDFGTKRYTIIGVAPRDFRGLGLDAVGAWIPMSTADRWVNRDERWYETRNTMSIRLVTRLRNERDALALEAAGTNVLRQERADSASQARLASIIEPVWPEGNAPELTMATRLAGVMAILLLIACANVANLLLARGLRRRREIAVRLALGVSRARLAAMLVAESVVLALAGGVLGFVLGAVLADTLRRALRPNVTWGDPLFEAKIGMFSLALALVTGLLAGLVPALRSISPDLTESLKAGARGGTRRSHLRNALIISQAALSVVLVAAAGLFVVSLRRVQSIDVGYALNDVVYAQPVRAQGGSRDGALAGRLDEVATRIRAMPGVAAAGFSENMTFNGLSFESLFYPDGTGIGRLSVEGPFASFVGGEYFDAQGLRILRGRAFNESDRDGTELVTVMNERMARAIWPGEEALGKCVIVGEATAACTRVVGIASNGNARGYIEDPSAQYYLPLNQRPPHAAGVIVVRAEPGQLASVQRGLNSALADLFPGSPPARVRTMESLLAPQLHQRKLAVSVYGAAAIVALVIATMGIYSSVSYAVGQRMHEMGVRAALGARTAHIVGLILGEGFRVVATGVVIGVGLALVLGKTIADLLYSTSTSDPVLLATVSAALIAVALLACFIPAWRATRANPSDVLRAD